MHLTVIGSGTVAPSAHRVSPAHWVEAGEIRLLMDCGAGALHRAASLGIEWASVTHVALTHFHADHWGELPHLLFALKWGTLPPRHAPLTILGPTGLGDRLTALADAFGTWILDPGYEVVVREVYPGESVALSDTVTLETHSTPHTEESLAIAVVHGTRRLVYTGDTGPSPALGEWARGCDLLLCECSLPDDEETGIHLTPDGAGTLARTADAGRLVLTHFYPQVESVDPAALAGQTYGGDTVAARDGDRFTL